MTNFAESTGKYGFMSEEWRELSPQERHKIVVAYKEWLNPTGETPSSLWSDNTQRPIETMWQIMESWRGVNTGRKLITVSRN